MLNRLISCILAMTCIALTIALVRNGASRPALNSPGDASAPPTTEDAGLERPIDEIRFANMGLSEAIERLRQLSGANIDVNWRSLEGAGVDREAPVSLTLRHVTLGQALKRIESNFGPPPGLKHYVSDGIITLCTFDQQVKELTTEVYDVRQLLVDLVQDRAALVDRNGKKMAADEPYEEALEYVEQIITSSVTPDMWRGNSPFTIREIQGLLVVVLPAENQKEVANLLAKIHNAVKRPEPLPTTNSVQ